MIKANFFTKDSGLIVGFDIEGHAGYAESGYDVVCAAVSSAAYLVINTIYEVLKVSADTLVNDDGKISFKVNDKDAKLCEDIMLGFKIHMIGLEKLYSENVIVNYMEV